MTQISKLLNLPEQSHLNLFRTSEDEKRRVDFKTRGRKVFVQGDKVYAKFIDLITYRNEYRLRFNTNIY